jgi:hypothetical protein
MGKLVTANLVAAVTVTDKSRAVGLSTLYCRTAEVA